jgi:hypothetical protein
MSDTFGATGLDADLPGLGPQTGNVRGPPVQLPSQLHALVQHFTGAQGKPSPQSPPQSPGQGKPPPKPRLGSTDPPDPTAYSYAPVPANVPRTPPGFTPYTMPVPRDSSQWNKPEPYPRQPQSFELPGLFQKMGGYFAQHGGAAGAPLGATSAAYAAAYQEAYMKGQEWKMRQAKEQLTLSNAKLADVERARQIDYADKFSAYQVTGGGDPTKLHDELWRVAVEHGDKDVMALLEGGASAEQVRRFLADHEAHIRALEAANSKSGEQDAEDAKRWGLPGGSETSTDPMDIPVGQSATPPRDQVAGPGGRGPAPEPGTSPAPPQSTPLKPYEQVGLDIARGRPSTGLPKKVADAAQEYAAGVDTRMDDVVAHSAGKTREQIAQELSAISPAIAADWGKLLDGKQGLPGGMGAIGARPYWSNLGDLSLAVKPSWSAADFQRIPELNKEYDAGPTGRRMGRTESMAAAGRTLLEALHQIPEGETPPEGALESWFNHTLSGDSKWGRVFSAYHTYVQEAQTIASQTGNFHETDVQRVLRETPYTAGPEFIRGSSMLVDAQNAVDTMSAFNDDYKSVVGRDALHYNPRAIATLQTIASYDPKTNQFRDVRDPTLKGLDRSFDAQPKGPTGQTAAPAAAPSPGWGALQ